MDQTGRVAQPMLDQRGQARRTASTSFLELGRPTSASPCLNRHQACESFKARPATLMEATFQEHSVAPISANG